MSRGWWSCHTSLRIMTRERTTWMWTLSRAWWVICHKTVTQSWHAPVDIFISFFVANCHKISSQKTDYRMDLSLISWLSSGNFHSCNLHQIQSRFCFPLDQWLVFKSLAICPSLVISSYIFSPAITRSSPAGWWWTGWGTAQWSPPWTGSLGLGRLSWWMCQERHSTGWRTIGGELKSDWESQYLLSRCIMRLIRHEKPQITHSIERPYNPVSNPRICDHRVECQCQGRCLLHAGHGDRDVLFPCHWPQH